MCIWDTERLEKSSGSFLFPADIQSVAMTGVSAVVV